MPEYKFLGVKTDKEKYLVSLAILLASVFHLVVQGTLFFLGFTYVIFPLFAGGVGAWSMIGRILYGIVSLAGTLCAMNIAAIESPWEKDGKRNAPRLGGALWTGVVALPMLYMKSWLAILLIVSSFAFIVYPRHRAALPEA